MADTVGSSGGEATEIRTFLIADVRGYTLFTQERGDEAAAKLATKFAEIAREGVEGRGGSVIELRGDEALAVFGSPRQAIRAAVDLQRRFVEETLADPSLPLMVGIGLDAGEAVPMEGGYRGGALNLAARLCGQAGPGEVLASSEVVHLARAVDGVRYIQRGEVHLKGLAEPVRIVRVVPEGDDPAVALAPLAAARRPPPAPRRPRLRSWKLVAAAAAVVVAVAVIVPITLSGHGAALSSIDANSVGLIDLNTQRLTGQVAVGARPTALASGAGAVWVANSGEGTVSRIDEKTDAVQTIPVGQGPAVVAVGFGEVWVANNGQRTVSEISPKTNQVVQTIPVGNGPLGIATGHGAVWVTNSTDATVDQIDPRTGAILHRIDVGQDPVAVAVGQDVWVANAADGTVSEIDPRTGQVVGPIFVGSGPHAIVATGKAVWVANSLNGTASRIDPSSGSIAQVVPVGDGPTGLAVTGQGLWVANQFDGSVSVIAPRSGQATRITVGNAPQAAVAAGSSLWVATAGSGPGHRGGTVTMLDSQSPKFDSIDPAVAYGVDSWDVLSTTNDGLVAFEKVGGPNGSTIVPDLAVAIPRPTDGGKIYTFQLRPGIRYSTGQVVAASDFRRAIERVFRLGGQTYYYSGIVGAASCSKRACDLSGVAADDRARTVTIRLTAPDPLFLDKLAVPFADLVPSGVGDRPAKTRPLPATGPYMIQSYQPGHASRQGSLVLVRNPRFKEWSPAAQPEGYPDRIVWRLGVKPDAAVTAIEQGRADWLFGLLPADRLNQLRTRYADQIQVYPFKATFGFALNTSVAPFDDVSVRRAVNYAVDRRTIADMATAFQGQVAITCQILPSNTAGYSPFCPYTVDPNRAGTWTGANFEKAKSLLGRAHLRSDRVTVWTTSDPTAALLTHMGRYLAGLLRSLGFHVTLKVIPNDVSTYFSQVGEAKNGAQAFPVAWSANYPSAADFLQPLFSCDRHLRNSPSNPNYSQFCDPAIDRMMGRALRLQSTDPPAAGDEWARVDRAVVNKAPWVPLFNPTRIDLVSRRVKNYQHNPEFGLLFDQLWVR